MAHLTTKHAAKYLSVSKGYLDRFRLTGGGPRFIKLSPKKVIYDTADLDRWCEAHKQESTADVPSRRGRQRNYLTG